MNNELMKAILAMDVYNRGYNSGIKFGNLSGTSSIDIQGTQLGNAIIYSNKGDEEAQAVGFYAVSYNYGSETIISYRGTDDPLGLLAGGDIINGWIVGAGSATANQAELAFQFYQSVANTAYFANGDWLASQVAISLTGHSLGGGLAGLVGATYNKSALMFDNMPFELAAQNTQAYSDPLIAASEGKVYNSTLRTLVYGSSTADTWAPTFSSALKTEFISGEALEPLRSLQTTSKTPINLGDSVNLVDGLDNVAAHSMATLLIRPLEVLSGIFDLLILEEAAYAFGIRFQHVHVLLGGRA